MPDVTDEQLTAFSERMRNYRPPNPSPRDPKMSTEFNEADIIERHLIRNSHQTWGFVIYRCTYDSDENWATFMSRLRLCTEQSFAEYNGADIMARLAWTVVEDRSLLDGATADEVRDHWLEWVQTAAEREQGAPEGRSARYRYCIQVDTESLKSVVHDAVTPPAYDHEHKGFANLIDRVGHLDDDSDSEVEDEGTDTSGRARNRYRHDLGWMRINYDGLYPGWYCLVDNSPWPVFYRRPPEIACR